MFMSSLHLFIFFPKIFYRLKKGKQLEKEEAITEVKKNIHLIKAPHAGKKNLWRFSVAKERQKKVKEWFQQWGHVCLIIYLQENPNRWKQRWCKSYKKTSTWRMKTTNPEFNFTAFTYLLKPYKVYMYNLQKLNTYLPFMLFVAGCWTTQNQICYRQCADK